MSRGRMRPAGQFLAVAVLGQKRITAKGCRPQLDGLLKWVLLECVQRIVMHEYLDRRLGRQIMSGVFDRVAEILQLLRTISSAQ